jgi:DNA-binding transcriptional regulator of glucitol operon
MPDNTKKKILRVEMNRYQELRDQIAKSKAGVGKQKKSSRPAVVDKPEVKQNKKTPKLVEEQPLLVEEQPKLVEEQPLLVEEQPELVEEQPLLVEERPTLVEEQPLLVEEKPSEPPAVAAREELILADEQPEVAAAIETLTQAVEEIKRCIHVEIKALKEEIQNLRMGK